MSFTIKLAKYRVPSQFVNGLHTVQIKEIKQAQKPDVFFITFLFENGLKLNKQYMLLADKYGPLDALIDAALPSSDTMELDLLQLIDKCIDIELLNEEINGRLYTNIKRVAKASRAFNLLIANEEDEEQSNMIENEPEEDLDSIFDDDFIS